jgi:hypothetical protein
MVPISVWSLTPIFDLDLSSWNLNFSCNTPLHNDEHLCEVILKSLYACSSFALNKHFLKTSICDIDLWPRDLIHARDRAFHSGEHFYEVSSKSLYACRWWMCSGRKVDTSHRQGRSFNMTLFQTCLCKF